MGFASEVIWPTKTWRKGVEGKRSSGGSKFVEYLGPARDLQRERVNGRKIRGCSIALSGCLEGFRRTTGGIGGDLHDDAVGARGM